MPGHTLTPEQVALYHDQGYLVVKGFCTGPEVEKLYATALNDGAMQKNALDLNDQTGKKTKLSLWFTPGNDVFGYLSRSQRMIGAVQTCCIVRERICPSTPGGLLSPAIVCNLIWLTMKPPFPGKHPLRSFPTKRY